MHPDFRNQMVDAALILRISKGSCLHSDSTPPINLPNRNLWHTIMITWGKKSQANHSENTAQKNFLNFID